MLIAYFVGQAWANVLPRGDKLTARWRARGGQGKLPFWITVANFINPGPWRLKEHAICAITATSASNASASVQVFSAQDLFYDLPLSATTVVLAVISIGLFGYGLCGILRPIAVWHVDAVYWSTLPTVKTLQGLHWQHVKDSKPIRWFWYCFVGMFFYEFFPAYIWPWLNAVSIPCLAAMKATGTKAAILTNLFGGSLNNEGLGLFSLSFDWQYVRGLAPRVQENRLTTDPRSPPSTPHSRFRCRSMLRSGILSALQPCLVSTTQMHGRPNRSPSCRHGFGHKTDLAIPSRKSSPEACSTKRPWRSTVFLASQAPLHTPCSWQTLL